MEDRHGLLVDSCLTLADGHAERVAALHMIEPRANRPTRITLGADTAYGAEDFVNALRAMNVTPDVAQNTSGPSLCDRRANDPARRLCRQPAHPQGDRGGIRLDQDGCRQEKTGFRDRDRVDGLFLRCHRLQSGAAAQADRGGQLMAKVPGFARPLSAVGASSRWTSGSATSLILSKRRISPSRASPMAKSPLGLSRASWMRATASATDRPAPSSHGKGTTRMIRTAVADEQRSALWAASDFHLDPKGEFFAAVSLPVSPS